LTYPNSYTLGYELANGLTNFTNENQLQLGCVYNFVDTMYVAWSYINAEGKTIYGLDRTNNLSGPARSWGCDSLIWDGGATYKQKRGARVKIRTLPLPAGSTLEAYYSIDRGLTMNTSPSMVEGDRALVLEATERGDEFQWGFSGTSDDTATQPVIVIDDSMQIDPQEGEEDMRKDEVNSITGTT
jgi:hypothetical protein